MSPITPTGRGSLTLLNSVHRNSADFQRTLERLSTGKRINRPSDDPAGFVAAEEIRGELARFEGELKGINNQRFATRQQQSTLSNIQDQLIDLRGTLNGASGNLITDSQRLAYDQEINAALESIDRLQSQNAEWGSLPVLDVTDNVRVALEEVDGKGDGNLTAAVNVVDASVDEVAFSQAGQAAFEKYDLDLRSDLINSQIETHTAALSQIEDADFAEETANLARSQVLTEGSLAALAFSQNSAAGLVLDLVEDLRTGDVAHSNLPPPSSLASGGVS